jgi:hypothetical protein
MSNPTSWSQVSGVVDFFQGEHQAIIGNKIYHFGGYQNGTLLAHSTIYSASVENPLSWSNTGASIPAGRTHSCLYVSKETGKIIIYGGGDSNASPVPQNTIYTASISNPLVWGTAPTTLPGINMGQTLMEAGDWIYLYGGYSTGSVIWRAHKTNPTVVSNTSYTLTQSLIFSCQPIQIGNYAYIFSNWVTNGTYRIDINKPWAPEFISGTMSIPVALMRKNPVFIAQNKIFHLGGTDHPAIHTSSYYITSSTTMTSSSLYQNATAVIDINKQTTQYSSVEKFGASTIWQTDINR